MKVFASCRTSDAVSHLGISVASWNLKGQLHATVQRLTLKTTLYKRSESCHQGQECKHGHEDFNHLLQAYASRWRSDDDQEPCRQDRTGTCRC